MNREDLIHNEQIKLVIFLKINQLKREQLKTLSYTHIMLFLFHFLWNKQLPSTIHDAIDDIMKIEAKDVVRALHTLAMIRGSQLELDKIDYLLGGEIYD